MPLRITPLGSDPKVCVGSLRTADGEVFSWVAMGDLSALRHVQREALEFCFSCMVEDALRFHVEWVLGKNYNDWEDEQHELHGEVEIPDCADEYIEAILDFDESQKRDKQKLFHAVMEYYGYKWQVEVYTPVNMPNHGDPKGTITWTWVIPRKR